MVSLEREGCGFEKDEQSARDDAHTSMTSATASFVAVLCLFASASGVRFAPGNDAVVKNAQTTNHARGTFFDVPELNLDETELLDEIPYPSVESQKPPFDFKKCLALVEKVCSDCANPGESIPNFACYRMCVVQHKPEFVEAGCMASMSDLSGGLLQGGKHCMHKQGENLLEPELFAPEGPFGPEVCAGDFPTTLQSELLVTGHQEHPQELMKKGPFLPPSCAEKVKELCGYCSGDPTSPLRCFKGCVKENEPALEEAGCPAPPTPECKACLEHGLEHMYNATYRKIEKFCFKHEDEPKFHDFCEFAKDHPAEAVVAAWCHLKIPVWKIVTKKCAYVCKPPTPPPPPASILLPSTWKEMVKSIW